MTLPPIAVVGASLAGLTAVQTLVASGDVGPDALATIDPAVAAR